jgi:septal ring factor EnvC (AmiA/AmiB activator)
MCEKCCCEEIRVKPTYQQLRAKNEELENELNRSKTLIHALEISLSNLASSIDRVDEERLYWKNECDELREQILNIKEG